MAELTTVQAAQLFASSQNREYFFEQFYKIPIVGRGPNTFHMRDYQKEVVRSFDSADFLIGLKARQIGWTTIGVGYALHDALFNEEHPWLFVSKDEDAAAMMVDKAKYALTRLPNWMKGHMPTWSSTQGEIKFSNGSRIVSVPATDKAGRGDSVYGALLDECAFMEYAEPIWGAVQPLVYGKAMIFSTANGMGNFFHDIWLDAQMADSVWTDMFYPWNVVPERDEDWYRRTKLAFRGREWLFYQEHPSSPEEAFAKSGRVAFNHDIVNAAYEEMEPVARYLFIPGQEPRPMAESEVADIEVVVYVPPVIERDERGRLLREPNYVVGGDFAEGLDHGDFTYMSVFNCNERESDGRFEQVAVCKSSIPIAYSADLMYWLGMFYHQALLVGERNAAGVMPLEMLGNHMYYPRLYRMDRFAEVPYTADRTYRFGWYTDRKSKPKMVNDFVLALTEGMVVIHDPDFLHEAQMFVADGKGSYAATEGRHDDVIMGTLVAWQGVLDSPHYGLTWFDDTIPPVTHDDIDALVFAPEEIWSVYEQPLGSSPDDSAPKRSIFLTAGNFK